MDKTECYLKNENEYDFVVWNWDTNEDRRKENAKYILKYIQQYDPSADNVGEDYLEIGTDLCIHNHIYLGHEAIYIVHKYDPNYEDDEIFLLNTKQFDKTFYVR